MLYLSRKIHNMLSILIPVYNINCVSLVWKLYEMALLTEFPFEILLADDASCRKVREENRVLNRLDGCRVLELETNHGPAFIRNYLGEQARYPYLLFLDTDTSPVGEDFLSLYLKNVGGQVVCGGFCYPEEGDSFLRNKYGAQVEAQPAAERRKHPYQHFISMNFFYSERAFFCVSVLTKRFIWDMRIPLSERGWKMRVYRCCILKIRSGIWWRKMRLLFW